MSTHRDVIAEGLFRELRLSKIRSRCNGQQPPQIYSAYPTSGVTGDARRRG